VRGDKSFLAVKEEKKDNIAGVMHWDIWHDYKPEDYNMIFPGLLIT